MGFSVTWTRDPRLDKDPPVVNQKFLEQIKSLIGHCEWEGCGSHTSLTAAHIRARGMGGGRRKDTPENIAVLCWDHHHEFDHVMGQSPENQEWLYSGTIGARPRVLQDQVVRLYNQCMDGQRA